MLSLIALEKAAAALILEQRHPKPYRTCGERKTVGEIVTHSLEITNYSNLLET